MFDRDLPLSQISASSVSRIAPARAGRLPQWGVTRNLLWIRTSSCLASAICTAESTSVIARSFTNPASRMVCAEDRWKKFLSLVSRAVSVCG
jgi:hypothetical protein